MNRASEEMRTLTQAPNQPISVYVYNYAQIHYLASGQRVHQEDHPFAIQEFITSLETNLKWLMAKKCANLRTRPATLQQAFTLGVKLTGKMQEAESFECNFGYKLPTDLNEIRSTAEVNEVSHGRWNNHTNEPGGYKGNYQKKDQKPWHNKDKKPWNNNDSKPWQNKERKPWQNKKSKPKDTCFTFSKDVKFFCPAGFDKSIFAAVCKLLQEKVEQVKKAESDNAKTINAMEKDNFMSFFNIPEHVYDAAISQVSSETPLKNLGSSTD